MLSTAASVAVIVALAKAPEYLRQLSSVAAVQTLDTSDLAAPAVAVPSSSEHSTEALFGVAIKDDPQGPAEQFVGKGFSDKSVSVDYLSQVVQPESPAVVATER